MKRAGRFRNYSRCVAVIVIAALGLTTIFGSGGGDDIGGTPTAKFTAEPITGPAPLEVVFDASASYAPGSATVVRYQWDFDDGQTGRGVTVSHTYTTIGRYEPWLVVTSDTGKTGSAVGVIRVGVPTAAFTAELKTGPALEVAFDASATSDPDGTIVEYRWEFGDGQRGTGITTTHTYTTPGRYRVTLTVTDDDGGTDSASQYIEVGRPNAAFTAQPTNGLPPLEVAFDASASSDEDGIIASYEWDFGDGESGEGMTTTHTYTTVGRYDARLTVTDDDGGMDSASQEIAVGLPIAAFTAQPTSGPAPLEVAFDASASSVPDGTIVSYRWHFGDEGVGDWEEGEVTISHTYTTPGTYTVWLKVTDNEGQHDYATQDIAVEAD